MKWLSNLFKSKTEIVYFPEAAHIKHATGKDFEGLLLDMVDGYEKHEAVFRLLSVIAKRKEIELSQAPDISSQDKIFTWTEAQKVTLAELRMLRYLMRLPIMGAKFKKQKETQGNETTRNDTGDEWI